MCIEGEGVAHWACVRVDKEVLCPVRVSLVHLCRVAPPGQAHPRPGPQGSVHGGIQDQEVCTLLEDHHITEHDIAVL